MRILDVMMKAKDEVCMDFFRRERQHLVSVSMLQMIFFSSLLQYST